MPPRERVHAPDLDDGLAWLNVDRPLRLADLRGQIVILDFWTYCCINCMHVLQTLRALEERHAADPVVVIGVHSAKFTGEKDPARIAAAIRRHDVRHPVVVDSEMRIWRSYGIRSWPTLVFIRPDGTVAAMAPGEPDPDSLEEFLQELLAEARGEQALAGGPPALARGPRPVTGRLAYPGKVAVLPDGAAAVSDSGNHRVVLCDRAGAVTKSFGGFDDPQGLAVAGGGRALYVADAWAHRVARLDLQSGAVETVAGTGRLGGRQAGDRRPAREVDLRSPWDVALDEAGGRLYVAMAGSHQIHRIDLEEGTIGVLAGTGAESIEDGPFEEATFSQPSGLALEGTLLYVADSETSSVRVLDLAARTVKTLVGSGLFDFGDVDGPADRARLQHCVGLCLAPAGVVVADTYNHKLRLVDRATGATRTLYQGGLFEPAGVAWDPTAGELVVADTNHHRLVRVTPEGRARRERTLELELPEASGAVQGLLCEADLCAPVTVDVERAGERVRLTLRLGDE